MAYTAQSRTVPAGSQTGPNFATSALANDKALQDQVLSGLGQGWTYSQSGGTAEEPTTVLCTNTTDTNIVFKAALTWTSGNITGATFSLSTTGSGGAFDTIGSAATFTYDGSGNLTATTNFGGMFAKIAMEQRGKLKSLTTTVASHTSTLATHGTMALQNANAVAVTGGSVSCTYEREAVQTLANGNAANTCNWSLGGLATLTATGTSCSVAHSNLPSGVVGYMTFDITNGGLATTLFSGLKWPGGAAQTFSAAGRDLITLMCRDGATLNVVGFAKGMA